VDIVEKHRSNGGHARRAGVGDTEGEGEEPRVSGGEGMAQSSLIIVGVACSDMVQVEEVQPAGRLSMKKTTRRYGTQKSSGTGSISRK
jgi:hypothetical protein